MKRFAILLFFLFATAAPAFSQNASPLGGVGSLQVFDNTGAILPGAVFYIYNAGTSVQATVYSDSTATTTLPNPVTLGSGARASIWLANGTFVKVVECLQNDGAFCAAGDQLFVADQIPIGSAGSSGNTGTFTGVFISSTASPATSGTLRLASGDTTCWRNAAGSANICWSKSSSDILQWNGGSLQLPEIAAPACGGVGADCWWADSTSHRIKGINNGGTAAQYVLSGNDVDVTDAVKQVHFGASAAPFSSTLPSPNQFLRWNGAGTAIVGDAPEATFSWGSSTGNGGTSINNAGSSCEDLTSVNRCPETFFASSHTLLRLTYILTTSPAGCTTSPVVGVRDNTSGTTLTSLTIANAQSTGFVDSGALSVVTTAGHRIGIGVITAPVGCSTQPVLLDLTAVYQ